MSKTVAWLHTMCFPTLCSTSIPLLPRHSQMHRGITDRRYSELIEQNNLTAVHMLVGDEYSSHRNGSMCNGEVARPSRVAVRVARPVVIWALLAACLIVPGQGFLFRPVPSLSCGGACVRSSSLVASLELPRNRGAGAPGLGVGSSDAMDKAMGDENRSGKTRLFTEVGHGHKGQGRKRTHILEEGGGSVAFLRADKGGLSDGHVTGGVVTDNGGDINGNDGIIGGGGQGGGGPGEGEGKGDGDAEGDEDELVEIAAKGKRKERIIRKVKKAVDRGKIPKECSKAYAQLLSSPALALLCKNSGWRARLLGDNTFITKLAIEMITGTLAQIVAEYQKRGKNFMEQLDFVFADTLTCLFANCAAVWLSCPTVAVSTASKRGAAKAGGALQHWMASCPSNAFQRVVTEGGVSKSFSVSQRVAAIIIPMPKLFVIGFSATIGGFGLIAGLETLKSWRHSRAGLGGAELNLSEEAAPSIPVIGSGLAIGAFLAVSTNLRYQFIAGALEQRIFDTAFAANSGMSSLASTVVRSANLYVGSLMIVDWLRCVGLQQ